MRARYLGDHDNFTAWGLRFPRGVFVPVIDAHAQMKIAGNRHFEVEQSDAEDVEFVETLKGESTPEAPADEPVAEKVSESAQEAEEPEIMPVDAAMPAERQKRTYTRRQK